MVFKKVFILIYNAFKNKIMTKKQYELYLNSTVTETEHYWTIGGKYRRYYMTISKYGTALRKYDPIAFEIGYNDYKRK